MITHRPFMAKVLVRFVRREDGGLRAFCDGVPGFFLSGADPRAVMRDVIPALEQLVRTNLAVAVKVSPLGYGLFQLAEHAEAAIDNTQDDPEYVREYVVERLAA